MATSSFDTNFVLDSEKAINSFAEIITKKPKLIKINHSHTSAEAKKRGDELLKQLLSR